MTVTAPELLGGLDYPRTLREFNAFFPDERCCLDYLVRLRWPEGFLCAVCAGTRVRTDDRTYARECPGTRWIRG